jgi:hypothetical protein
MRHMPPVGQRDLDDLRGDPFLPPGTPLHDKPDPERQRALQDTMDRGIRAKQNAVLERFGPPPESLPAYLTWKEAVDHWQADAEQSARGKVIVGGLLNHQLVPDDATLEQMLHADNHLMPTSVQGAIDGVSGSDFELDDQRNALARETTTSLWDDYQISYGHDDPEGVARAAQAVVNELRERGVSDIEGYIKRNRAQFMEATNWWHRRVIDADARAYTDDGRTAGLSGYGNNTPGPSITPDTRPSTTEDILREMARARGW